MKLKTILSRIGACDEARAWAADQPDLQTAWANCRRSDWMIWLLARTTLDRDDSRLRLMACDFAEAVLHLIPAGEDRPRKAIEVARRFAAGEATREEMDAARDAAWDAAWDARDAARDAAWDARDAARDAASAAAWAASAAAWDASAAAWDAAWDARDAARDAAWADQATIIRNHFPVCPEIKPELLRVHRKSAA